MQPPISASRETLLDSAQTLLVRHGYAGLSMRELARQSGLAKSTIYHHFHDKREIFLCVLERDLNRVGDRVRCAAESEGSWTERLMRVVRTCLELQRERRPLILTALRDPGDMQGEVCELLKKFRARLVEPIAALIAQGIEIGEARPVRVEVAVLSLLGIVHGFVGHHMLVDGSTTDDSGTLDDSGVVADAGIDEDAVESALQIFLYGITRQNDSR